MRLLMASNLTPAAVAGMALDDAEILDGLLAGIAEGNRDCRLRHWCHLALVHLARTGPEALEQHWEGLVAQPGCRHSFARAHAVYVLAALAAAVRAEPGCPAPGFFVRPRQTFGFG